MNRNLLINETFPTSPFKVLHFFKRTLNSGVKKIAVILSLFFIFSNYNADLYAQCCANGPNLLANYNADFQAPIPVNGVPPGFQSANIFVPTVAQAGAGKYLIIPSRSYGACSGIPQYDHTFGNSTGRYMWFDTPGGASVANPSLVWKPYDPNKPAGTENLLDVTTNTDYVFGVWIRDLARSTNCISGGAPVMGLRINGVDMAQINLGIYTSPCCPEWVYLCTPWNSGDSITARIQIESRSSVGFTDLGVDDIYFGTSSSPFGNNLLGNDTTICTGNGYELVSPFPNALNVWNGTDTGATFWVNTPGTYWLYTLDTVNNSNCEGSDTIVIGIGSPPAFSLGADFSLCNGESFDLFPNPVPQDSVSYLWSNNSTQNFMSINSAGTVWLEMSNGCGTTKDSVHVTMKPNPQVSLPNDIVICLNDSMDIAASVLPDNQTYTYNWTPSSYLRDDFSKRNKFSAPPGTYQIKVTATSADGCKGSDSMTITILNAYNITAEPSDTSIYYGDTIQLRTTGTATDIYSWTPKIFLDSANISNPKTSPLDDIVYKVIVVNESGCRDSGTVKIKLIHRSNIFVPNAFSPNGDGINDEFRIYNFMNEKLQSFLVYNRYGQLVFKTIDAKKGWDGTQNNKPVDAGVYFYYISIKTTNGIEKVYKGDITLVR